MYNILYIDTHEATWVHTPLSSFQRQRNQNMDLKQKKNASYCSTGKCGTENNTSDLIWLAGLGDLGNRILCRNRRKLCGGGVGEKGGAGLLNEDIPGEYLMLLILGCSTDCSVAKLFRSNHFEIRCFVSPTWCAEEVNITAYNVEGDPLVRGTDYEASWLGLLCQSSLASIWVQYLWCFVQLATGSVKGTPKLQICTNNPDQSLGFAVAHKDWSHADRSPHFSARCTAMP